MKKHLLEGVRKGVLKEEKLREKIYFLDGRKNKKVSDKSVEKRNEQIFQSV